MSDERRRHVYKVTRDKNGVYVDGVSVYQLKMKMLRAVCEQMGVRTRLSLYSQTRGFMIDAIYRNA